ncbi:hypothetical protein BN57_94 [Bifidobacterium longum subsp. longum CECT 7347]|nr:hypothetical protein BN57_94 [Bifidobacterium longum subsp. longum CECT 7347]
MARSVSTSAWILWICSISVETIRMSCSVGTDMWMGLWQN